ncbi:hypothetical protein PSHT_00021 [Puccinia striiformis]|uniref:Uncharacterized protein n=1 Tax=Puccinia striiformis TaxID=27350 RepID=A0A2S4WP03_9BASI|nr:hypothetical protein PSHT_00021 [Puccinia striiformis]
MESTGTAARIGHEAAHAPSQPPFTEFYSSPLNHNVDAGQGTLVGDSRNIVSSTSDASFKPGSDADTPKCAADRDSPVGPSITEQASPADGPRLEGATTKESLGGTFARLRQRIVALFKNSKNSKEEGLEQKESEKITWLQSLKIRLKNLWRPLRSNSVSSPAPESADAVSRIFDVPFSEQANDLHGLVRRSTDLEKPINEFVDEVFGMDPALREKYLPQTLGSHEINSDYLKRTLLEKFTFLRRSSSDSVNINLRLGEIYRETMTKLELQLIGPVTESNPTVTLGEKMMNYKNKMLLREKKALRSNLGKKYDYLVDSFGLFGPKNIIAPHIRTLFADGVRAGRYKLRPDLEAYAFMLELETLQVKLGRLANEEERSALIAKEKRRGTGDLKDVHINGIKKSIERLENLVGGSNKLKQAIHDVENMDVLRGFMRDLNDPKTIPGFQLQMIDPWGYWIKKETVSLDKLPLEGSLSRSLEALNVLEAHSKTVETIVSKQLQLNLATREIEQDILATLNTDALKLLRDWMIVSPTKRPHGTALILPKL